MFVPSISGLFPSCTVCVFWNILHAALSDHYPIDHMASLQSRMPPGRFVLRWNFEKSSASCHPVFFTEFQQPFSRCVRVYMPVFSRYFIELIVFPRADVAIVISTRYDYTVPLVFSFGGTFRFMLVLDSASFFLFLPLIVEGGHSGTNKSL